MANFQSSGGFFPSPMPTSSTTPGRLTQGPGVRMPFPCISSNAAYQFPSPVLASTGNPLPCATSYTAGNVRMQPLQAAAPSYAAMTIGEPSLAPSATRGPWPWQGMEGQQAKADLQLTRGDLQQLYPLKNPVLQSNFLPDVVCHNSIPAASVQMANTAQEFNVFYTDERSSHNLQSTGPLSTEQKAPLILPHTKRRVDMDETDGPSAKVFVNEERMAARMQGLHLDNNNMSWHPNLEEETGWFTQHRPRPAGNTSSSSAAESASGFSVTGNQPGFSAPAFGNNNNNNDMPHDEDRLAPDVEECASPLPLARLIARGRRTLPQLDISKDLVLRDRDILPKSILDQIVKPRLEVVLWKPPGTFVRDIVKYLPSDDTESGETEMTSSGGGYDVTIQQPDIVLDAAIPGAHGVLGAAKNPDVRNTSETMATEQFFNPSDVDDMDL